MYNAQKPTAEDLPSSAQLLRSTAIAAGAAAVILFTVVLPSEYNIDPTGIGGVLGLTEMGEIKQQLAEEAEADRLMMEAQDEQSSLGDAIFGAFFGAAYAQEADPAPAEAQAEGESEWTDEVSFSLEPGEGTEIKLAMEADAVATFSWSVEGGVVNYDLHGDGEGNSISYQEDRAVPGHDGELTAAFTGNHGWFWRNRGDAPVTVTLRVAGDYSEVVRYD
jgi:hypothetical protein